MRGEDLALEAADRKHTTSQRDLTGHRDVLADGDAGQGADHSRGHGDARRGAVLGDGAGRHVDVQGVLSRRSLGGVGRRGAAETTLDTKVDGVASLTMEIVDLDDPVEVGVETAYEIRVKNGGSKSPTTSRSLRIAGRGEVDAAKGATDAVAENRTLDVQAGVRNLAPVRNRVSSVHVKGLRKATSGEGPPHQRFAARTRWCRKSRRNSTPTRGGSKKSRVERGSSGASRSNRLLILLALDP